MLKYQCLVTTGSDSGRTRGNAAEEYLPSLKIKFEKLYL